MQGFQSHTTRSLFKYDSNVKNIPWTINITLPVKKFLAVTECEDPLLCAQTQAFNYFQSTEYVS